MAQEVTLYDLPSRNGNHCWSPNTWKSRLYLNYKGLPYKTVWIEYPDIKPTLKEHVAPDNLGLFTLPTVLLPDGTYLMDSKNIAQELEKRYPTAVVQIHSPISSQAETIISRVKTSVSAEALPKVPRLFLNEASQLYFYESRAERLGMPLDQFEEEKGGEQCFTNVRPHIRELTALLKQNSDGPFFGGLHVTWADIEWVSLLKFYQRLGDELIDKVLGEDKEVHLALYGACQTWLERDNY